MELAILEEKWEVVEFLQQAEKEVRKVDVRKEGGIGEYQHPRRLLRKKSSLVTH